MSLGSTLAVERPLHQPHGASLIRRGKPPLTPRQQQFVEGLIAGRTVGEIGTEFHCTDSNVYLTLRAAQLRSGCRTREQLVVWWDRRTRATLMTNDTAQSAIPDNRGAEPHTSSGCC
jgi:DNA-binding NarL/FixJ family response regulator